MRRRLFVFGLACLLLLVYVAARAGDPDDSWERVQARGTLRVGMDASFPPFEVTGANGAIEGLDVELSRQLAQELGLPLTIVNIAFDGLYDALAATEVDVLISALPYDEQRSRDVRYSPPYFVDGLAWLLPASQSSFDPADFRGTVAVEMGSEAAQLVRQRWPNLQVLEVMSESEVVSAVAAGAPAGLVTRTTACAATEQGLQVGPQVTEAPYVVAVNASSVSLADAVFAALDQVMRSSQWDEARKRWLGDGC